MSGVPRHTVPVDVHLILRRDGKAGPEVLLSRRAGPVYATGLYHCPSGHLDPEEDMVEAVIREACEETGVLIDPEDVTLAVTVHHSPPVGAGSRFGMFFEVRRWSGQPEVREPDLCDDMGWYPLEGELPEPMVAYCRAGLDAYRAGLPAAVHFQEPGDPISYATEGPDRTLLVPGPPVDGPGLPHHLRVFAERAVGRITGAEDVSWVRTGSRVWRITGAGGGTWYLKRHRGAKFHDREVAALRFWAGVLGAKAPRLVAVDTPARAVVITALTGRPLHGTALEPAAEAQVQHGLGQLVAALHRATPTQPAGPSPALGKVERHLKAAGPYLAVGDEALVLALARAYADLPAASAVPTHGDLQYRNVLIGEDGGPRLLDFERSEYASATRDMVRLSDTWTGRDDLKAAFLSGYGRQLDPDEELRLDCEAAFDAVSGIAYGMAHGDPEVTERGRRTLLRLHTARRS
ncbi:MULTISPECIES: phosphotransferase [Streptomyces]|uniref:phosphotransferase n=2 Tax=Streptomyces TaxID=1883 RepID=UPI002E2CA9DF|nr:phosphotransferase [Streptomyces sp. NBC_00239]